MIVCLRGGAKDFLSFYQGSNIQMLLCRCCWPIHEGKQALMNKA